MFACMCTSFQIVFIFYGSTNADAPSTTEVIIRTDMTNFGNDSVIYSHSGVVSVQW